MLQGVNRGGEREVRVRVLELELQLVLVLVRRVRRVRQREQVQLEDTRRGFVARRTRWVLTWWLTCVLLLLPP